MNWSEEVASGRLQIPRSLPFPRLGRRRAGALPDARASAVHFSMGFSPIASMERKCCVLIASRSRLSDLQPDPRCFFDAPHRCGSLNILMRRTSIFSSQAHHAFCEGLLASSSAPFGGIIHKTDPLEAGEPTGDKTSSSRTSWSPKRKHLLSFSGTPRAAATCERPQSRPGAREPSAPERTL